MRRQLHHWFFAIVVAALCSPWTSTARSAETFGNFHTMGVVLDVPGSVTPTQIDHVRLFMLRGDATRRLLDPVQVHDYSFYAGSVFDLEPGTQYQFRAEFVASGGRVVHREEFTGRTRAEPGEPPVALREIHVAKSGADTNPGTASRPKQTIASALKLASRAGTHVVVHQGIYYEGDLPAVARGTTNAPIVIRGAKGESVIIDGSDDSRSTTAWKELGGGYFSTPYKGQTWVVCVEIQKNGDVRRMYPVGSLANLKAKTVGGHRFGTYGITEAYFCTGTEIVVYCPYYNPGESVIHVAHRQGIAEHSSSQHVIYSDLTCRFFHCTLGDRPLADAAAGIRLGKRNGPPRCCELLTTSPHRESQGWRNVSVYRNGHNRDTRRTRRPGPRSGNDSLAAIRDAAGRLGHACRWPEP